MLYFALGLVQVRHASFTVDEGPHLAVGYATLRTGDYRLQPVHIHPPLANLWAAWPLLFQNDLPDPRQVDGWSIASLSAISDAIVWRYPDPAHLAFVSRVPILLWGVLLGALLFRWTETLGGLGNVALLGYTFDPNLLAHGGLVTTDMGATLFTFAMAFALWRLGGKMEEPYPRWRDFTIVGAVLGLAQLVKVSTLLLIPLTGLILLHAAETAWRRWGWKALRHRLVGAVWLFGAAFLALWAGYRFQCVAPREWPFSLPAGMHVQIFQSLYEHYDSGHSAFLAGQLSRHGWWWYFPFAFAVKTPLPTVIAVTAADVILVRDRWRKLHRKKTLLFSTAELVFLLPGLYAISALLSSVDIGYRHLLPILPFLFLGIGVAAKKGARYRALHPLGALLALWLMIGTLRTLPYPLTFFNELVGGPSGGYRYLVDSNLDWGQNLWDLRDWMRANGVEKVFYAHYSPARPEVYGVHYHRLPPAYGTEPFPRWNPPPGIYAIGATVLQGAYVFPPQQYEWFRAQEPIAVLGHALFLYRVEPSEAPRTLILCANPVPPLEEAEAQAALGLDSMRTVRVNCRLSFVYPASGPSYLIAPPALTTFPHGREVLRSRRSDGSTAYRLFAVGSLPPPSTAMSIPLDGPLTLLGYTIIQSEKALELRTFWEVTEGPITRPLSLLAHLSGASGNVIQTADGLGFSGIFWQHSDRFIERHRFELSNLPPEEYTLFTGAYWLDELTPWPREAGGEGRIALTTLHVEP